MLGLITQRRRKNYVYERAGCVARSSIKRSARHLRTFVTRTRGDFIVTRFADTKTEPNAEASRFGFPGAVTNTLKLDGIWQCSFARKIIASHPSGRFLDATKGSFAFHVNNRTMWHRRQPAARAARVNKIKFHPAGTAARHVDLKDYSPFPHSCHLIFPPV